MTNTTPSGEGAEALPEPLGYISPGDIEHIQSRTEQYRGRNYNIKATVFLDRGTAQGSATEGVYTSEQVRAILADRTARAAAPVQSIGEDARFFELLTIYAPQGGNQVAFGNLIAHIDNLLAARPSAAPVAVPTTEKAGALRALTKDEIEDTIKAINSAMNPAAGMFFPRGWNVIIDKLAAMLSATPSQAEPVSPVGERPYAEYFSHRTGTSNDWTRITRGEFDTYTKSNESNPGLYRLLEIPVARTPPAVTAPDLSARDAMVRDAAEKVISVALDEAMGRVHVCDRENDDLKARAFSDEMQALYRALRPQPAQKEGE